MQELLAANIQMRIITEQNISQLDSLGGSDNITRLTGVDSLDEVVKLTQIALADAKQRAKDNNARMVWKQPVEDIKVEKIHQYRRNPSPAYVPAVSAEENTEQHQTDSIPYPPSSSSNEPPYAEPKSPSNSPPQQRYEPKSPSNSPPQPGNPMETGETPEESGMQTQMFGGSNVHVGSNVLYRGSQNVGAPPQTLWTVRTIRDGFVTIGADSKDVEGRNAIQVVSPEELYLPTDAFYRELQNQLQTQMQNQMQTQSQNHIPFSVPQSGININPIIKIVNGPDNSVGGAGSSEQNEHEVSVPNTPTTVPSVEPATSDLGKINFDKLVINKNN